MTGRLLERTMTVCLMLLAAPSLAQDEMAKGFLYPPDSARPWVYWYWLGGNVSKEGITADLEAMKRVGLGGADIFDINCGIPSGPVATMSLQWLEMIKHTVSEAARLGLQIGINNCPGWTCTGGPWTTPDHAMQIVVTSELQVKGPAHFSDIVPKPPVNLDTYHDIAVLAFKTPPEESSQIADFGPKVTASASAFDGAKLIDGTASRTIDLPAAEQGKRRFIRIELERSFPACALTLIAGRQMEHCSGMLQSSDDGETFKAVQSFTLPGGRGAYTFSFDPVRAQFFRVLFTDPSMPRISLAGLTLDDRLHVDSFRGKVDYERAGELGNDNSTTQDPARAVSLDSIVDLTARIGPNDKLEWDVPEGRWTIVRLGYTPVGANDTYAQPASTGLECDKMSREAVDAHFAGMMQKIIDDVGPLAGKTLTTLHVHDSYVGSQNWTPRFLDEFRKRRGYDPLPYLPVLSDRVVGNLSVTDRFLWDLRRTIAELFAGNHYQRFAELAHQHGMVLAVVPRGNAPFNELNVGGCADVPVGNFYASGNPGGATKEAASIGHVYGHPIVEAQSFTADEDNAKWQLDPYSMKAVADGAFCMGVNRLCVDRCVHQAWPGHSPGVTMGAWGIHFDRTNTWWDQGAAWVKYLSRCQYLLQQGVFVADALFASSEDEPGTRSTGDHPLPEGFDSDNCSPEALFTRTAVKDGNIVLPDGMSYRMLVLDKSRTVTPDLLKRIRQLAADGATILGEKPTRSPSLQDYPRCDSEVKALADELWGDGQDQGERACGKGKIIWGKSPESVLAEMGVVRDFEPAAPERPWRLAYIHRRAGDTDIYFVSNARGSFEERSYFFRVSGKVPELWYPDTGRVEMAPVYCEEGGRTRVLLRLDPAGSVFVVFRIRQAPPDHLIALTQTISAPVPDGPGYDFHLGRDGGLALRSWQAGSFELKTAAGKTMRVNIPPAPAPIPVTGPWQLRFPPRAGAPPKINLEKLTSWTSHGDPGVRYFSGTAAYVKDIDIPEDRLGPGKSLFLDLGTVKNLAQIKVNGEDLGVLWKPPFRLDITGVVHAGANSLEIRVTNLWPNRLIGDEQLPEDSKWKGQSLVKWPQWLIDGNLSPTGRHTFTTYRHWTKDSPLLESGLIGPVTLVSALDQ